MPSGIRASVAFSSPEICPIVRSATAANTSVEAIETSVAPSDGAASVTEFSIEGSVDVDVDARPILASDGTKRYRVHHEGERGCPCECLGRHGCAVSRYVATEGSLTIEFYAADYDELSAVVDSLRTAFSDLDIKRLIRSPADDGSVDLVGVDRSKLTGRQLEVLETAQQMGYFERPRGANATEIADELGIGPSTFSEHLAAAQSKLLADIL
jgi:predicted DNA binding protein